jgi:hypothetical protein
MFSPAALRTSRPRIPRASLAPITVTEGGGAGSFGTSVEGLADGSGVGAADSSAAANAPVDIALNIRMEAAIVCAGRM